MDLEEIGEPRWLVVLGKEDSVAVYLPTEARDSGQASPLGSLNTNNGGNRFLT